METDHNETVIDKAVNFVKDAFGIQHDTPPEVVANPEYQDPDREEVAESRNLDPFIVSPQGQVMTGRTDIPISERSAERPIDRPGSEPIPPG